MRVWYNGNTLAFQANDAGSIPATRSIYAPSQKSSIIHHDSQLLSLYRDIFFSATYWLARIRSYSSAVEHSLGKGEVLSSILNMSSIYCYRLLYLLCYFHTEPCVDIEIIKYWKIINTVWQIMIWGWHWGVAFSCCQFISKCYTCLYF